MAPFETQRGPFRWNGPEDRGRDAVRLLRVSSGFAAVAAASLALGAGRSNQRDVESVRHATRAMRVDPIIALRYD